MVKVNGISWVFGALIYVAIFATSFRFGDAEEIENYAFLTNTEATIEMLVVDVVVSLLMAATTSAYLVYYCRRRLCKP